MYHCPDCGSVLECSQDPDEFAEYWCPEQRECEHKGCLAVRCGDEKPEPCDMCGLDFCHSHMTVVGDARLCEECRAGLEAGGDAR